LIWVIGCNGMLGKEVSDLLESKSIPYIGTDIEVDITDKDSLDEFISSVKPPIRWIINCSAYTAVDKAEDDREKAFSINSDGVYNIASIARNADAQLIHISTDYVFDGNSTTPYSEDDTVSPLGVYGESKEAGERHIRNLLDKYYIFRTSWLYGRYGPNFVTTMLRLFNEKDMLGVVGDQRGCPTWTYDLVRTIYTVISDKKSKFGTYHFSNLGETTWYGFAKEIYNQSIRLGLIDTKCEITSITTGDYPTRTKRPEYSVLNKNKIQQSMKIAIPRWESS
jgi:dTDP-4-dehydrorhamnose reductase